MSYHRWNVMLIGPAVPMEDKTFPGSQNAFDFASFDTRFYKVSQCFEKEHADHSTDPRID